MFSATGFDRTVARGDEEFNGGLDCQIAYSVRNVERRKTSGDPSASGDFYGIAVRSHFDKRTIGTRQGDRPLRSDPPTLPLIDGSDYSYPFWSAGQQAWETAYGQSHSLGEPLRPGRMVRDDVGLRRAREAN